jgi:hypothetical protein
VERSGQCRTRESGGLEVCTRSACGVLKEVPHMHVGSAGSASWSASHLSSFLGGRADTIDCHDSGENVGCRGGVRGAERGERVSSRASSDGGACAWI